MQLTTSYQRISTANIIYDASNIGQIRTYGKIVSQDKVNNITTYKLKQTIYYNGYDNPRVFKSTTSKCDGTSKVYTTITIQRYAELTLQELTRTIQMNPDGTSPTKSVSTTFSASGGISTSATASITFPKIDRYAYISGTLTSANDESTFYFDYKNPLGLEMSCWLEVNPSSTHLAVRSNIGTDTSGTYTWTLTTAEREALQSALTNAKTGTIRIGLSSVMSGTTQSSYKDIPFSIVNANPTFDVAYQDTNATTIAITSNNQQIIQNKSTLQINITNASALKQATLSSVSVNINGAITTESISSATKNINIGTLDLTNNTTASITLTDSRGNILTKTIDITILKWEKPTAIITLNRQDNFYTATNITVDANYSSLDSHNTITIQYRYKKTSDNTWGNWNNLSDNVQTTFNIDNRYSWNVEVKVEDLLGSQTYNDNVVEIGIPKIFMDRLKKSLGINCLPVYENSVEVEGKDISHQYTTAERPVGTWIDGKTIYRKTFEGTFTANSGETTISNTVLVADADKLIRAYGTYNPNGNTPTHNLGGVVSSNANRIDAYGSVAKHDTLGIVFREKNMASSWYGATGSYSITVEYTKTS